MVCANTYHDVIPHSLYSLFSPSFSLRLLFLRCRSLLTVVSRRIVDCSEEPCNKRSQTLTSGDPVSEQNYHVSMNTRRTLDLTDTPISDLQLISNLRRQTESSGTVDFDLNSKEKKISSSPTPSSNTSDHSQPTGQLFRRIMENNDLSEWTEIQQKHATMEKRFLDQIPIFQSPQTNDIEEFISKAEEIFEQLKYSDEIRILKIEEKIDDSHRTLFILWKQSGKTTWNDFKAEFPKLLHGPTLSMTSNEEQKSSSMDYLVKNNPEEKCSTLNSLQYELTPFSGDGNPRQWFVRIDSKFSELKLSMDHRMEILPYFLVGDATIWFSSNREKFRSYTDFCQLFVRDYLQLRQSPDPIHCDTTRNEQPLLQTSSIVNEGTMNNNHVDVNCAKTRSPVCHSILSTNSNQNISFNAAISPTISKALIDRFVKDPIKFHGGKEDIIGWIDEIEQQFAIMNLCDADKLNLIHICLKGETHLWYRQNKQKFLSWSIFIDEITKSFTSNLQRDMAFEKLKQYQQSIHQSVNQYYNMMIKLMKQADPEMNETTRVQYLMNGLRPSLSTETRRNYPRTTQDFLKQAKIAEELTALNSNTSTNPTTNEEFQSSAYLSSVNPKNSTSPNDPRHHQQYSNKNSFYRDATHPPNDKHTHYSNRIPQSSSKSYDHEQAYYSRRQPINSRQSNYYQQPDYSQKSNYSQQPVYSEEPLLTTNNNRYSKQDSRYQQQPKQSSQQCFRCGSTEHLASQCHHFERRSQ